MVGTLLLNPESLRDRDGGCKLVDVKVFRLHSVHLENGYHRVNHRRRSAGVSVCGTGPQEHVFLASQRLALQVPLQNLVNESGLTLPIGFYAWPWERRDTPQLLPA